VITSKLFQNALIVLMACASVLCLFEGDFRRFGYWAGAVLLNLCATS
jgi:hypothetical protein